MATSVSALRAFRGGHVLERRAGRAGLQGALDLHVQRDERRDGLQDVRCALAGSRGTQRTVAGKIVKESRQIGAKV